MPGSDSVPAVSLGLRRWEHRGGTLLPCAIVFLTFLILDTNMTKVGTLKCWFTGWKKHYLPNLPQRRTKVAPQKNNSCLLMITRPGFESLSFYSVFHPQAFLRLHQNRYLPGMLRGPSRLLWCMNQATEQLAQQPGPEGSTASEIQRPLGAGPPPLTRGEGGLDGSHYFLPQNSYFSC